MYTRAGADMYSGCSSSSFFLVFFFLYSGCSYIYVGWFWGACAWFWIHFLNFLIGTMSHIKFLMSYKIYRELVYFSNRKLKYTNLNHTVHRHGVDLYIGLLQPSLLGHLCTVPSTPTKLIIIQSVKLDKSLTIIIVLLIFLLQLISATFFDDSNSFFPQKLMVQYITR